MKKKRSTNDETQRLKHARKDHFLIAYYFVIRHSSFVILSESRSTNVKALLPMIFPLSSS
ncbi:MAG: hypothetical protein DME75_13610 [Verrucomicrobia bacterium]|nr:MAG: hypothetical protein DME75_13610 [Verrucomicrobiota bacterium]